MREKTAWEEVARFVAFELVNKVFWTSISVG